MKLLNTAYVLAQAEDWLRAHPRGHIEMQADGAGGYSVVRSYIDPATGNEGAGMGNGEGETLADALAAAMEAE
jgi:hypothetical protein